MNDEPDGPYEDREVRGKSWWQFGTDPSGPDAKWYDKDKGPEIATAILIFTIVIIVCGLAIAGAVKVVQLMF